MSLPSGPTAAPRVIETLKDGYWDRTEVIALPDGSRRVRKRTKGTDSGPWGMRSLQREIRYFTTLPEQARAVFPPVLATWDHAHGSAPDAGYEMPYYAEHADAGALARSSALSQEEIDVFQDALAEAVLERLHAPAPAEESLAAHVTGVMELAWDTLEHDPALTALITAETVELNGATVHGPRAAFKHLKRKPGALAALDAGPPVRLHGDLFLENILWRPSTARSAADAPRLILIDPVSVAGVTSGPPVFDLVKYVSYATGELPALRSERVVAEVSGAAWQYRIRREDPALEPFRARDWHSRFQRAFESRHGPIDRALYHLIDAYFSAAMALNTRSLQRLARILKATADLNAALSLTAPVNAS